MGGSVWGWGGRQIERRWERVREGGRSRHMIIRGNLERDSRGDEIIEGCHTPDFHVWGE